MFQKVLIANRGEIALRVIRACRELGVATVAVYSAADESSLHVAYADEAVCVGPPPAAQSYLVMQNLIMAAVTHGADAIHPGYGFLAENAAFSRLCADNDITFIGPGPESIELMGDKAMARATMTAAGVPVTPGSDGRDRRHRRRPRRSRAPSACRSWSRRRRAAAARASASCTTPQPLPPPCARPAPRPRPPSATAPSTSRSTSPSPRHVEIQVLADGEGHAIHLGERDCSIQRRHQKLIEEAPSPAVSPELRARMGEAAVEAARAARYKGAGTVEFLLDPAGDFYFMEMNTRVQVEHCVTEMVTGIDIVKTGIRIAAGEGLPLRQERRRPSPATPSSFASTPKTRTRDFLPSPGTVTAWSPPGGPWVRFDSHVYPGYTVPPFYDSLLGKLVVWGRDRDEALARARWALAEFRVEGVATTIPFHLRVLDHPLFRAGTVSTHFIDEDLERRPAHAEAPPVG